MHFSRIARRKNYYCEKHFKSSHKRAFVSFLHLDSCIFHCFIETVYLAVMNSHVIVQELF